MPPARSVRTVPLLLAVALAATAGAQTPVEETAELVVGAAHDALFPATGDAGAARDRALSDAPAPSPACEPHENPHRYVGAAGASSVPPVGFLSADVVALGGGVAVHDGAADCHAEGADLDGDGEADLPVVARFLVSDGDPEFGQGGGFFPETHHGEAYEVTDASGGRVGFTVASDADGDGVIGPGECRETFIRRGATGCSAGADGGWWVILHERVEVDGEVSAPPTSGVIASGPVSAGSRFAGAAALASATITFHGDTDSFTWSSPAGWDCTPYGPWDWGTWMSMMLSCRSPPGLDWDCQNNRVFLVGTANGGTAAAEGTMECGPYKFATCDVAFDATHEFAYCTGKYDGSAEAEPFLCTLEVGNPPAIERVDLECFNDP